VGIEDGFRISVGVARGGLDLVGNLFRLCRFYQQLEHDLAY